MTPAIGRRLVAEFTRNRPGSAPAFIVAQVIAIIGTVLAVVVYFPAEDAGLGRLPSPARRITHAG
ncbi:MAG TPA: hypothetical protein VFW16_09055 [Streptosporangiaceae bacterium]|nr:hypothetical protein [Streptosporangiaceae bacterium]